MQVQRDRRRGGTAAVRAAVPVMKILLLSSVVTNASRPRGSSGFPAAAMAGMRRLRGGSRVEEAALAGDAPVETAVAPTPPLYRELPLGALAATASGTGGREDALLRACAAKGDVAGMTSALENGANVHCYDSAFRYAVGWTALHHAAKGGHEAAVLLLLQAGAAVDAVDYMRTTPLMLAARGNHDRVVSLLLTSGADAVRAEASIWPNNNGRTALHWASYYGHAAAAAALCEHVAAAPRAHDEPEQTGMGSATSRPNNVLGAVDALQRSALHWAARRGHAECLAVLLHCGAQVAGRDRKGKLARELAAAHAHDECTAMLLRVEREGWRPASLPRAAARSPVPEAAAAGAGSDKEGRGKLDATVDVFLTRKGTIGRSLAAAAGLPQPAQSPTSRGGVAEEEAMRAALKKLQVLVASSSRSVLSLSLSLSLSLTHTHTHTLSLSLSLMLSLLSSLTA